jgi:hypothetical protein
MNHLLLNMLIRQVETGYIGVEDIKDEQYKIAVEQEMNAD